MVLNRDLEVVCEKLREEKIKAVDDALKYKEEIVCLKNEIQMMEVSYFYILLLLLDFCFNCWKKAITYVNTYR